MRFRKGNKASRNPLGCLIFSSIWKGVKSDYKAKSIFRSCLNLIRLSAWLQQPKPMDYGMKCGAGCRPLGVGFRKGLTFLPTPHSLGCRRWIWGSRGGE
jgi:hypothetical protein